MPAFILLDGKHEGLTRYAQSPGDAPAPASLPGVPQYIHRWDAKDPLNNVVDTDFGVDLVALFVANKFALIPGSG